MLASLLFRETFRGNREAAIPAIILVVPEITQGAAWLFTTFIDSVFFPGGREKRRPTP